MVLIAILVAALFQLFLPNCRLDISKWFRAYLQKMIHVMGQAAQNTWLSVIFLCLPVWIVVLLLLALFNWILGPIVYWVLVFFISWLCLDMNPMKDDGPFTGSWLEAKRDAVFSPIFWFAILKTPLLVLYSTLRFTRDNWPLLEGNQQGSNPCGDVLAVLAWIPARLMVVAAAVVGDFIATMKAASSFWLEAIRADSTRLVHCLQAALREKTTDSEQEVSNNTGVFMQYRAVFIVWLVVIAIFTIGYWVAA